MDKEKLKPCPFCGGEAKLIEYYETCDGRGDKSAKIKCKCGLEMTLNFDEFCKAQNDFNYNGGYYSQNKEFWDGMHQMLIDKWNTRKPIDKIIEQLEEESWSVGCSFAPKENRTAIIKTEKAIKIVKGEVDV